jgi:hypothetical protein
LCIVMLLSIFYLLLSLPIISPIYSCHH